MSERRDPSPVAEIVFREPIRWASGELASGFVAGDECVIHYIHSGEPSWPDHYRVILLGDRRDTYFFPASWCAAARQREALKL